MTARHTAGARVNSRAGVRPIAVAIAALLGLIGYLAATSPLATGATQSSATVSLRATSLGKVLVTSTGRTLYLFMKDKDGMSSCSGQCAVFWPPLISTTKPTAGAGVKASLLGRTKRADGRMQVTYAGHPLYRFKPDTKAGETNGEGINHFGGLWWAVNARGLAVKHAASGATTTTTSSTSTSTTTTSSYRATGY